MPGIFQQSDAQPQMPPMGANASAAAAAAADDSATPARRGEANCRTCTDFKSWAKRQQVATSNNSNSSPVAGFLNLTQTRQSSTDANPMVAAGGATTASAESEADGGRSRRGCPYDKDELGNSTWGLLHTMAAHYPDKPTQSDVKDMSTFFTVLSKFYPCEVCAKDFQQEIKVEPINATSQSALSQWLCRLHNKVNLKLGKPVFDCSLVDQRWRDGWTDGSCD